MSDKRKTILPGTVAERMQRASEVGREAAAEAVFALPIVLQAISAAAAEGFDRVTVEPGKLLDLRAASATRATVEQLQADGFRVEWEPRPGKPGEAGGQALKVSWPGG